MFFIPKLILIPLLLCSIIGCTFNCAITTTVNKDGGPEFEVACSDEIKEKFPLPKPY